MDWWWHFEVAEMSITANECQGSSGKSAQTASRGVLTQEAVAARPASKPGSKPDSRGNQQQRSPSLSASSSCSHCITAAGRQAGSGLCSTTSALCSWSPLPTTHSATH